MPDHDFLFALDLSDEAHFDRMLQDLARVVLRYVGFDAPSADAVTGEVRSALAAGAADGNSRCDVRFQAGGGALRISVTFGAGRRWELARTLPAGS